MIRFEQVPEWPLWLYELQLYKGTACRVVCCTMADLPEYTSWFSPVWGTRKVIMYRGVDFIHMNWEWLEDCLIISGTKTFMIYYNTNRSTFHVFGNPHSPILARSYSVVCGRFTMLVNVPQTWCSSCLTVGLIQR